MGGRKYEQQYGVGRKIMKLIGGQNLRLKRRTEMGGRKDEQQYRVGRKIMKIKGGQNLRLKTRTGMGGRKYEQQYRVGKKIMTLKGGQNLNLRLLLSKLSSTKKIMMLKGGQNLRLRLLLSTLSSTPVVISRIRADSTSPGLRPHERSLLKLLEKVSDGCFFDINYTGTRLVYLPGIVMGGKDLVHNCLGSRSIGYFLEPLIVLALFGKKPLSIILRGITNDPQDPSVDTFRSTTLHILKHFGVNSEGLELKIESRGVAPGSGGEILLSVPILQDSLKAVNWTDEGLVKRIRGVTFSTRVSVQLENTMIHAARGIFNRLLPDVHIFTDHKVGPRAGKSPGYGISLVAETTSGCFISVDTAVCYGRGEVGKIEGDNRKNLIPPEEVGEKIASQLLDEIERRGVVDSSHQGFLFLLCALCPQDVSKVRVGKISRYGEQVLQHIREFLGVTFVINEEPSTERVNLKCVGRGLQNISRKLS